MESTLLILNIILLEIILSIDNAAVLAAMVDRLPKEMQSKALTYGIFGAYMFRGLALVFAAYLIQISWLKLIGGGYLIYLGVKSLYFTGENPEKFEDKKQVSTVHFWKAVVAIEFADLIFSIDNIFAAVAFTSNIYLICIGVFLGIIAMRFAVKGFVHLIHRVPTIEKVAYYVVFGLGVKLVLSYFFSGLTSELVDLLFSIMVLFSFLIPFAYHLKSGK